MRAFILALIISSSLFASNTKSAQRGVEDDHRVILTTSYLFLHQQEGGLDFAKRGESSISFDEGAFHPAIQVAMGFHTTFYASDLDFIYTRYHQKDKNQESTNLLPESYFEEANVLGEIANKLEPELITKLDLGAIEWIRPYLLQTSLIAAPIVGLSTGIIKQAFKLKAFFPIEKKSNTSSDNFYIGPRLGAYLEWPMVAGFFLLGRGAIDLTHSSFSLSHKEDRVNQSGVISRERTKSLFSWHSEVKAGIGYRYRVPNEVILSFALYYSLFTFSKQNQMVVIANPSSKASSLLLQGICITGQFDF